MWRVLKSLSKLKIVKIASNSFWSKKYFFRWILSIFVLYHIFPFYYSCVGIKFQIFSCSSSDLDYWATQYIIQTIQVNHWAVWMSVDCHQICNYTKVAIYHHLQGCPHCRVTVLEHHTLVLLESTQSYIDQLEFHYEIGLSVYARIWTDDPWVFKVPTRDSTIELIQHWQVLILILTSWEILKVIKI